MSSKVVTFVTIFGSWTPTIASIVAAAVIGGRQEVQRLLKRYLRRPGRPYWYLVTLTPLAVIMVSVGLIWFIL